jgi:hypothetical protein
MKKIKYSDKLNFIRNFTSLGINKRASFTPQEKRLISKYYNILRNEGVLKEENNKIVSTVKFVKSKKKVKGKPLLSGYFIKGAKPNDKINRQGQIITDNYIKTFIAIDFSEAVIESDNDEPDEEIIEELLIDGLTPYYEELKTSDYFSLVVENGFEVGRGRFENTEDKKANRIGQGIGKQRKITELVYEIQKLLKRSVQKYKIAENLLSGIYLWKFINQKKPNKKQSKIIKRGKRK